MIQDIAPHVFDNSYHDDTPCVHDRIMVVDELQLLMEDENGTYPTYEQVKDQNLSYTYLFAVDQTKYFLSFAKISLDHYHYDRFRWNRMPHEKIDMFTGITALQLARWYQDHRYCGHCGNKTIHDVSERKIICPICGHEEYPKISPAVIIGVRHDDKILMSVYANAKTTHYALLAGFAEVGETIEETVKREVREEVGLRVKNLVYYKSQPWSFSDSLLMGFYCDLDGDDTITLDTNELQFAKWVKREDVVERLDKTSLTSEMIHMFRIHQDPKA